MKWMIFETKHHQQFSCLTAQAHYSASLLSLATKSCKSGSLLSLHVLRSLLLTLVLQFA